MISLIVAMDKNNVIGYENDMPWHLPNDLKYFKERTIGHTIVMGRKTFESLGKVLPKRKHIVLTRGDTKFPDEVEVIHNVSDIKEYAVAHPEDELFVIGGGHVFEQVLPFADRIYLTVIDEAFKGDVFFPEISKEEWKEVFKVEGIRDEKNVYNHMFYQYDRK